MHNVEKLQPTGIFTNYIYKAIPLAFDESMSYYETLCGLLAYLKDTVIPTVNNNADAIIEVQNLVTELQNYVDNYFENLDVQEEINNKLDEMASDGTLAEIIAEYVNLKSVLAYNTVADMSSATNLTEGSIARTLGKDTYDDKLGAFYKIRQYSIGDVIDGYNIVALDVSDTLIAERTKDYYIDDLYDKLDDIDEEIETQIEPLIEEVDGIRADVTEVKTNFNNNKQGTLNLMNHLTYDFGNYYTQGMAVDGTNMYVYKELNNSDGKLLKFDLESNTLISETSVDLKHGNDMCVIDNKIYCTATNSTKDVTIYDLVNTTLSTITIPVDENQIACIAKETDNTILVVGNNDNGTNWTNANIYRYNLETEELTKLPIEKNILLNFYCFQTFTYLKGYLYLLVSNPDQIIKIKVNDETCEFENIYNLPEVDGIGLKVGEYEGISVAPYFGDNAMIISSHILDSTEIGRTLKTYVINPINNVPYYITHYPNIEFIESVENRKNIFIDSTSSLIELGTENYPFHTLNRALDSCRNRKTMGNIRINNTANLSPFNLYCDTIADIECNIECLVANSITINYKRIVSSNINFDGNKFTLKNKTYSNKDTFGTIKACNITFREVNFDVRDAIHIYNSNIKCYNVSGVANNSDNYIFCLRFNSVIIDGINWANLWTTNSKKPYKLYGVSELHKISDVGLTASTQSTWVTNNVDFQYSESYCILFQGKHTAD